MVSELSADLQEFIAAHVKSFVRWDLVVLFSREPGLSGDVELMAARMGRGVEELQDALDGLVQEGTVAKTERAAGHPVYTLTDSHVGAARDFVESLEDREKRLAILTYVVRQGVGPT